MTTSTAPTLPESAQPGSNSSAGSRNRNLIAVSYVVIVLCSVMATILLQEFVPADMRKIPSSTWEVFYGVFGVIYAIIIGFILAELLTRFHRLISDISNELNALQCIRDFLIYIDDNEDTKPAIQHAVRDYLSSILYAEWAIMERNAETINADTSEELYALMNAVEQIRVIDESDRLALGQLINNIAEVTVYRTQRFDHAGRHLSPLLHILILFMSIVMVVGIILISVPSLIVHTFMVVSMVTAVFLLYIVVIDLNMPFRGVWNISPRPFHEMLSKFDAHP